MNIFLTVLEILTRAIWIPIVALIFIFFAKGIYSLYRNVILGERDE